MALDNNQTRKFKRSFSNLLIRLLQKVFLENTEKMAVAVALW
jgi:hypothetical protein